MQNVRRTTIAIPEGRTSRFRPRISVIIPAYHSQTTVAESLEALREQTFRDFQTIVVDSSADDQTARIISESFPEAVLVRSPTRLYPHAARNLGVARAVGDILVFTDPDCRARPDWLERLVNTVDAGHPVVGGSMALDTRTPLQTAVHLCKFSWLLPPLPAGPRRVVCTANAAYTRAAWDEVGPFDGDVFTGDALLAMRAAAAGLVPFFEPCATVAHTHEGGVVSYLRQFVLRGSEFAAARARQEDWGRGRCAAWVLASPVILLLHLLRAGGDALRAGVEWTAAALTSLPLQTAFRLAWTVGEARALAELTGRRKPFGPRNEDIP